MRKIKEFIRLKDAGSSNRDIAASCYKKRNAINQWDVLLIIPPNLKKCYDVWKGQEIT